MIVVYKIKSWGLIESEFFITFPLSLSFSLSRSLAHICFISYEHYAKAGRKKNFFLLIHEILREIKLNLLSHSIRQRRNYFLVHFLVEQKYTISWAFVCHSKDARDLDFLLYFCIKPRWSAKCFKVLITVNFFI
jgi:hypothetical protein